MFEGTREVEFQVEQIFLCVLPTWSCTACCTIEYTAVDERIECLILAITFSPPHDLVHWSTSFSYMDVGIYIQVQVSI